MTGHRRMRACRRAVLGRAVLAGLLALAFHVAAHAGLETSPVPRQKPLPPDPAAAPAPGQYHTGSAGWLVADLDSGAVLDAREPDRPFAPASVAKLPTAFYVLDRLGSDFRFQTRILAAGDQSDGTLRGDLVLLGGGDPELDTDDLQILVDQMHARGMRHVTGRFIVDGTGGPRAQAIDADQPPDAAYNPALSGLNLNFNRVRLKWDARKGTREMRVSAKAQRLDPEVAGVQVTLASLPGTEMFVHRLEGRTEIWQMNEAGFRGKGARWLPVRRPEIYAGEVFQSLARDREISVLAADAEAAPESGMEIARHQSRPLQPMVKSMLRYSTNLTAEAVGFAASRKEGPHVRTLADSSARMNAWAAGIGGFAVGDPGFQLANHSGLSTRSRVSPRRMVDVLRAAALAQPAEGALRKRLPGGVLDLLQGYNVAAKSVKLDYKNLDVLAKTGTMDYVRGLAGFVATPSGRRLVFAVFSNDLESRGQNGRRADRRWMAQARDFERRLIRGWVKRFDR